VVASDLRRVLTPLGWWGYDPGGEDGFGKSLAGENGEGRVMWSMQTQDMDVVSIRGGLQAL